MTAAAVHPGTRLARAARELVTLLLLTVGACLGATAMEGAARPAASAAAFSEAAPTGDVCAPVAAR